mmetsp:Transcript_3155/g.4858  ORF Transcript_3155/g.4858 Transcript_3155/m.4858 type:complete len:231 (+) Transcript_3155:331-1023(+)
MVDSWCLGAVRTHLRCLSLALLLRVVLLGGGLLVLRRLILWRRRLILGRRRLVLMRGGLLIILVIDLIRRCKALEFQGFLSEFAIRPATEEHVFRLKVVDTRRTVFFIGVYLDPSYQADGFRKVHWNARNQSPFDDLVDNLSSSAETVGGIFYLLPMLIDDLHDLALLVIQRIICGGGLLFMVLCTALLLHGSNRSQQGSACSRVLSDSKAFHLSKFSDLRQPDVWGEED